MSAKFFKDCRKVKYSLRQKSVSSTQNQSPFWDMRRWTQKKLKQSLNSPDPPLSNNYIALLVFVKFDRRFLKSFSQIIAPLTQLTSPKVSFICSEDAEKAFQELKNMFASAPVLHQPNPSRQFVVKVDAYRHIGVGAILSQRSP